MPRRQRLTRRHALIGAGTLLAGSGAYAAFGTDDARAAISLNDLTVDDAATSTEDGTVPGVWLLLDAQYDWQTVDFEPTGWKASLIVADEAANFAPIATHNGDASGFDGAGSFSMTGDVLAHDDFDSSDFTAGSDGASVSQAVSIRLKFEVLVDGATLASDMVEDTATVTVENTGGTATLSAAIGGDGSIAFSDPA